MDRQLSGLTKVAGLGILACTSVHAICSSRGDAVSIAFVLLADAALVPLFLWLRAFEQPGRGRDADARTKAAVWALTTLLTATVASGAVPSLMPLAVGALVFLCLRDVVHVIRAGDGGGRVANMDAQYSALAKVGVAVVTCNAALDAHDDTRRDPGSAALVLVSYAVLVLLTSLFVRAVARAHAGDGDHGQGQG